MNTDKSLSFNIILKNLNYSGILLLFKNFEDSIDAFYFEANFYIIYCKYIV
jgi:hypothetical protein